MAPQLPLSDSPSSFDFEKDDKKFFNEVKQAKAPERTKSSSSKGDVSRPPRPPTIGKSSKHKDDGDRHRERSPSTSKKSSTEKDDKNRHLKEKDKDTHAKNRSSREGDRDKSKDSADKNHSRDREKRRDRDDDRDRRKDRDKERDREKNKDRDREKNKDRDRDRDRDRHRDKDKDRDRDRDRRRELHSDRDRERGRTDGKAESSSHKIDNKSDHRSNPRGDFAQKQQKSMSNVSITTSDEKNSIRNSLALSKQKSSSNVRGIDQKNTDRSNVAPSRQQSLGNLAALMKNDSNNTGNELIKTSAQSVFTAPAPASSASPEQAPAKNDNSNNKQNEAAKNNGLAAFMQKNASKAKANPRSSSRSVMSSGTRCRTRGRTLMQQAALGTPDENDSEEEDEHMKRLNERKGRAPQRTKSGSDRQRSLSRGKGATREEANEIAQRAIQRGLTRSNSLCKRTSTDLRGAFGAKKSLSGSTGSSLFQEEKVSKEKSSHKKKKQRDHDSSESGSSSSSSSSVDSEDEAEQNTNKFLSFLKFANPSLAKVVVSGTEKKSEKKGVRTRLMSAMTFGAKSTRDIEENITRTKEEIPHSSENDANPDPDAVQKQEDSDDFGIFGFSLKTPKKKKQTLSMATDFFDIDPFESKTPADSRRVASMASSYHSTRTFNENNAYAANRSPKPIPRVPLPPGPKVKADNQQTQRQERPLWGSSPMRKSKNRLSMGNW